MMTRAKCGECGSTYTADRRYLDPGRCVHCEFKRGLREGSLPIRRLCLHEKVKHGWAPVCRQPGGKRAKKESVNCPECLVKIRATNFI